MATSTLVNRKTAVLSDAEKATAKADKAILSILKSGDKTTLSRFVARVNAVDAVLSQEGDGNGKRFSGAENHTYAEKLTPVRGLAVSAGIPIGGTVVI
jgi:hypothetical protein